MPAPLRILHLEDNPRDAELIKASLEAEGLDCDVVHVKNREQFEAAVVPDRFDLILSDYAIPHYNGFSALDFVRRKVPDVPFILLSGTLGEELAVESLKTGATDYILKERLNRLAPAVLRAVREARERGERRAAEEKLRATDQILRHLLAHSPAVIYGLKIEGGQAVPNVVSENITQVLGFTVEEALGSEWWEEQLHPDDRARAIDSISETLARAGTRAEYRIRHKDGSYRWVEDHRRLIRDPSNQPREIVGVWADITDRKRLEEHLQQGQKMEAIGQLAGGIAHDFNNILTCIVGYTELAGMDSSADAAVQENLQEVLKASQRAKELVMQILTFSRQQEQERKPVKVESVVNEALKLLRASLPSTIEINAEIQSDLPAVLANETQLHQIIMNLATNAAHAMKRGPGQLGIKLSTVGVDAELASSHPDLRVGRYVRLSVSDTGAGMDQATLKRIFEPFFTTKAPGEGTGLGLSVVHGIMKSYEGAITVSSEPGKGTTFQLYFPAHKGSTTELARVSADIPQGTGQRILFIDDEAPLASLGKKMLEHSGYVVTAQTSSSEALAEFRKEPHKYDLVITDLTMPTMTGDDLARELLKIRPDLPIVLATGFGGAMDAAKAQALGIRELLMKPSTAQTLAQATHRALSAAKPD